jgi:hypothetical protein
MLCITSTLSLEKSIIFDDAIGIVGFAVAFREVDANVYISVCKFTSKTTGLL